MAELSDYFEIEVNGEMRTVKMTFGLLQELCRLVGNDPERVSLMQVDMDINKAVLKNMLAPRTEDGKLDQDYNVDNMDVDYRDIVDIVGWATGHVTDFIVSKYEALAASGEMFEPRVKALFENVQTPELSSDG